MRDSPQLGLVPHASSIKALSSSEAVGPERRQVSLGIDTASKPQRGSGDGSVRSATNPTRGPHRGNLMGRPLPDVQQSRSG